VLYDKQIARMLPHRSDLRCRFTGSHLAANMHSVLTGDAICSRAERVLGNFCHCHSRRLWIVFTLQVLLDVILLCTEHTHDGQQQQFSTNFPRSIPRAFRLAMTMPNDQLRKRFVS
jgi:hypothetical protein